MQKKNLQILKNIIKTMKLILLLKFFNIKYLNIILNIFDLNKF